MKYLLASLALLLSFPVFSDTLYQADAGGAGLGVGYGGIGVGVNTYSGYPQNPYGYSTGVTANGVVDNSFTYPYGSGCCGSNLCNNCNNNYSVGNP
jgi:hypothetical protein